MKNQENLQIKPTTNPLDWRNGNPTDMCKSWYMIWYKAPWNFGYFNAFKSKESEYTTDVIEAFLELLKWRIDMIVKSGSTPIIVLPPRKNSWDQTMKFVVENIEGVEFIKIKTPEYRGLHFLKDKEEREKTIESVFPKWKVKFNPEVLEKENVHYIFVDDFYTTGTTTKAVFKAIQENTRLPEIKLVDDELTNFDALYMARTQNKRNAKSRNMWIVDFELSEKVNKLALDDKFKDNERDSSFYKKEK
ncbi:hypothetical protein MYMA111404_02165 [Mycoplasma marinum]|uniref:Phosphoribosyltransferase domain-containing protein n=1 Tax=Mycoplasma marinum TaxID=1937190 RepID=A0A4R0XWJ4_9MOLU|nr:hypothetical protein [Mycoplasma marinum]TCG11351.1 hypothetical protein C4B24_02250 [Mycoplasma marinum]